MKLRTSLSLVIALSLLVSITSFPVRVYGQQGKKLRSDTGIVTLAMGQVLRITVNGKDGNDTFRVQFAWKKYAPAGCNPDGVCRHTIQSQGVSAPVNVAPNEAASFDVQGTGGDVRVSVRVNTGDVIGDEQIINTATGEVTSSQVVIWFVEGDF